MPRSRGRALLGVAAALAGGELDLRACPDVASARSALESLWGIGPWTSGYLALRGLGDPDVDLSGDLVIDRQRARLGLTDTRWAAPWRSTLMLHVYASAPLPALRL